jgi:hypothetical protein
MAARAFLTGVLLGLVFLLVIGTALAQGIDAAPFDALLKAHVKDGVVDYPAFQDSAAFRRYVDDLAKPATLRTPQERLAHYVNAYNALAIQGILDGLSPATVVGRIRFFKLQQWPLDGGRMSLDDLEQKLIRPLGEPRFHFAIVCASKSCPFLRAEAYMADRLDAQLDAQARQFVNDPFRNRFDRATRSAALSEIFKWFAADFGGAGEVPKFVARYVAEPEVARELAQGAYRIEWIDYDWNLNGVPPRVR